MHDQPDYILLKTKHGYLLSETGPFYKRGLFYCARRDILFRSDREDVNCCFGDFHIMAMEKQLDFSMLSNNEHARISYFKPDEWVKRDFPLPRKYARRGIQPYRERRQPYKGFKKFNDAYIKGFNRALQICGLNISNMYGYWPVKINTNDQSLPVIKDGKIQILQIL